jgi:probable HAF family extracellular repeat protein
VVGSSGITGDQAVHATLWNGASVTDLGMLGGISSWASAINDTGLVVGASYIEDDINTRATLWNGDTAIDLNSLLDPGELSAGWVLGEAFGINDKGWIVGNATNDLSISPKGFLLIPSVPVPPALWLSGSGLLGLLGLTRSKTHKLR